MSDQISLFDLMSETPVVSEPTLEVVIAPVIALEEPEQPVISPVIALETAKEVVYSLAEKAGMTPEKVNDRIVVVGISQELGVPENTVAELIELQQEEQTVVSADTLSPGPEPVITPVISPER